MLLHLHAALSVVVLVCCDLTRGVVVWEGESAVLSCGNNTTDTDIQWCKETEGGCEIVAFKATGGTQVSEPPWTSSTVRILENASLDILSASFMRDNGSYQCIGHQITYAVHLFVLQPMKSVTLECPATSVNSIVNCTCEVDGGKPAPTISWYMGEDRRVVRSDTAQREDRLVYRDKYEAQVTKEMNGKIMKCQAVIMERSLFDEVTLKVKYKPNTEVWTYPTNYSPGEEVLLFCSADGNPKPHVIWMFERSVSSTEDNVTGNVGGTSVTSVFSTHEMDRSVDRAYVYVTTVMYKIDQMTELQSGTYTCCAMNEEGNDTKSITLLHESKGSKGHQLSEVLYRYVLTVAVVAVGVITIAVVAVLCKPLSNNCRIHADARNETIHDTPITVRWTQSVRRDVPDTPEMDDDLVQYEIIDENLPPLSSPIPQ